MMKKKLKSAFLYATIVATSLNLIGFLFNLVFSDFENAIEDFKHVGLLSLSIFFVPCFFTVINFKVFQENNFLQVIKSITLSFLLTFVVVYILVIIQINLNDGPFSFVSDVILFNSIISSLISIPSYLIYYLLNRNAISKVSQGVFPIKNGVIIWVIISAFYIFLLWLFSARLNEVTMSLIFAEGLVATILTHIALTITFRKNYNQFLTFSVLYIINSIFFPYLVLEISFSSEVDNLVKFVRGVVLIGPYFLTLTLIIHANYIYLSNKKEKQQLKQIGISASLRYQQLKAQISPHFLFNNISVLTALIEEKSKNAATFSQNLAEVYRYLLDQEKKDLVVLKDELTFANRYIELLKIRFENAISIIDETTNNKSHYILPLALQQVLENVIKHNEVSEEKPITISLKTEADYLIVQNNVNPKVIKSQAQQIGIKNIKNRYAYFTNTDVIVNKNESHYTIKLPILKIED